MSEKKEEAKPGIPPETTGEEKPAANKKKLIIMGAAGLLVVLVGAGSAFLLLNKGNKTAAAHGAPEAAENEHGEAKKDGHGEAKKDEHGEAKKDKHGEAKKDEHGEAKKDEHGSTKAEASTNYGQIYPLKPFHMNLGNPLENRYLRLEISFDYRGSDPQKAELDARTPQIRDIIVNTASRKTMEFLLGPDGKDQLRYEIFTKLNQILDKKIEAVYITDILVE
jgi:flagellar FliL protein